MKRNAAIFILFSALALDFSVWSEIYAYRTSDPGVRFLDVGQGDATLISLENGVQILTDAGPGNQILDALEKTLPRSDRYIDIGIVTHAEADHFGGFLPLLERYEFGVLIWNGRDPDSARPAWSAFKESVKRRNIPYLILKEGDSIRIGEDTVSVISPGRELLMSSNLNDGCLVTMNTVDGIRILLACDGGFATEKHLLQSSALGAAILKAGHHGSKFSSNGLFLETVSPQAIIISAGEENSYGHPAEETLSRFAQFTSGTVFRTDRNGTVSARRSGGLLIISSER